MSKKIYKILSLLLCLCLVFEQTGFAQSIGQLDISGYLTSLRNNITQDKFRPLHLRFLSYDTLNNNFKLLLDKGDLKDIQQTAFEADVKTLLNYFFVGISLPNDTFWVNLRPDSPDNIIDPFLAETDVGKILLEADLQLKKDTAKFTSPQTPEGKEYWDKLYKKAGEIFGYENITIPTLTRPWIVPGEIIVTETQDNAYIYKATLKVLLEQDYLKDSAVYNFNDERLKALNEYSSQLIRELIIPKITQEVNTSQRYSSLRQVYYSLILAQWFKQRFPGRGGYYTQLIDRRNLTDLTSKISWSKTTYFKEYQKSFKNGEYNLNESVYTPFGQTIRSYFSGGIKLAVLPEAAAYLDVDLVPYGNKHIAAAEFNGDTKQVKHLEEQRLPRNFQDKVLPAGSIYSIFQYLCDNDITTTEKAISGEKLAKFTGEKHAARQKALSFESIEDDLRGLLLHLHLIERVPSNETGKDAQYYVPEEIKNKEEEILLILEQFKGKNLRPKVTLLDQIYEEKIKPILEASSNSKPITNEQQFGLRIQDIRERYYSELNNLRHQNANDVIKLGAAFRQEVVSAIKDLFDFLKVENGIVLIAGGSFARNQHVEGSDFDWYFIIDGSDISINLAKSIQRIFSEARIQLDEDIIPRFNPRDGPKPQDDWEVSSLEKTHWLTIDEVAEFYNREPFAIIGKIIGTLDTMYIAGDRPLYARIREVYETNNTARIGQIRELIVEEIKYTATREFNPQQFNIKSDKGMILSINDIFWLLQLKVKELRLDWEFKNPIDMLDYYATKGYLSAEDKDSLTRILCFYLLLRNSIVSASASYYVHPAGYETEYFKEISANIATRMGFDSTAELEKLVSEYSNKVVEIQKRILANCDGGNRGDMVVNPNDGSSPVGTNNPGGIDFRALPIVSQPLNTPGLNLNAVPISKSDTISLDSEWSQIQNMLNAGIIPSSQRVKEYFEACSQKNKLNSEIDNLLNCIADIMRLEEERALTSNQAFKDLLILIQPD